MMKEEQIENEKDIYGLDIEEMYKEAVEIITQPKNINVSFLQRKLRIGYMRAAHILDLLEERGMVSPPKQGSLVREVLTK